MEWPTGFTCRHDQHDFRSSLEASEITAYICRKCGRRFELFSFSPCDEPYPVLYYGSLCDGTPLDFDPELPGDAMDASHPESKYFPRTSSGKSYVFLDPDVTIRFYPMELLLRDVRTGETLTASGSPSVFLGSAPQCGLQLDDPQVSPRHALLSYEDEAWFLEDCGSESGTFLRDIFLNCTRLKPGVRYRLPDDARIVIGDRTFAFCHPASVITPEPDDSDLQAALPPHLHLMRQLPDSALFTLRHVIDMRSGASLLVKCVKAGAPAAARQTLKHESLMLSRLSHPRIPALTGQEEAGSYPYLIRRYIPGTPLSDAVKQCGAAPWPLAVRWARQIADVLSYLHAQQPPVFYLDLKPANLILDGDGSLHLIDFGSARTAEQAARQPSTGTHGYAAPEQCACPAEVDARTDLYALGMTMLHLLFGLHPVQMAEHADAFAARFGRLPPLLQQLLAALTAADPQERMDSCAALSLMLDALAGEAENMPEDAQIPAVVWDDVPTDIPVFTDFPADDIPTAF